MTSGPEAPFRNIPGGIDIARYFWHEIVMSPHPVTIRRGQYHGVNGIELFASEDDNWDWERWREAMNWFAARIEKAVEDANEIADQRRRRR